MSTGHDDYRRVADSFVTEADRGRRTADDGRLGTAIMEVLLVGHLPVRAGLWLAPYADAVARQNGPVALVRLDKNDPSIQVLRGPAELDRPSPGCDVRDAINQLGHAVRTWIVLGRSDHQPQEAVTSDADRITLLSSGDPAAVVAAYDIVKKLTEIALAEQQELPRIGLAILGAEEQEANRVFERVNRTTASFLDVELDCVLTLPKMDSEVRSTMYLDFPGQPSPSIQQVGGWVRHAASVEQASTLAPAPADTDVADDDHAQPSVESQHTEAGDDTDRSGAGPWSHDPRTASPWTPEISKRARERSAEAPVTPAHSDAPAASPISAAAAGNEPPLVEVLRHSDEALDAPHARAATEPDRAAHVEPTKLPPKPQVEFEPKQREQVHEPDQAGKPVALASYVEGLKPLPPRCPTHEHIELAVDERGRIHLLGREAALRDLHCVTTWAKSHRELLSMACPEIDAAHDGRIICHVFTDQPTRVSDLHGGEMRLHLLAPVDVEGKRAWFAAALN